MINLYLLSTALIGLTLSVNLWFSLRRTKEERDTFDAQNAECEKWISRLTHKVKTLESELEQLRDTYHAVCSDIGTDIGDAAVSYDYSQHYIEQIPFSEPVHQCDRCGADMRETAKMWLCDACGRRERKE